LYAPFDADHPGTVGDYIDDLDKGTVVVIDNAGREDATVWGDILTYLADRKALGGTVIDGACRDTQLCRDIGYPVFSRSYSMRTGKDRVQVASRQVPVTIGGAVVAPGDLLRGDSDGVVVIPKDRETEVLDAAEHIDAAEKQIRDQLKKGSRLDAARKNQGYHGLQTRDE
jgi:regulator of RNase E activity RraA